MVAIRKTQAVNVATYHIPFRDGFHQVVTRLPTVVYK